MSVSEIYFWKVTIGSFAPLQPFHLFPAANILATNTIVKKTYPRRPRGWLSAVSGWSPRPESCAGGRDYSLSPCSVLFRVIHPGVSHPRCIKPHINHRNKKTVQPDLIWRVPCYCRCCLDFLSFLSAPFFRCLPAGLSPTPTVAPPTPIQLDTRAATRVRAKRGSESRARFLPARSPRTSDAEFHAHAGISISPRHVTCPLQTSDFNNTVFPPITSDPAVPGFYPPKRASQFVYSPPEMKSVDRYALCKATI